jgi:hypothetical protein
MGPNRESFRRGGLSTVEVLVQTGSYQFFHTETMYIFFKTTYLNGGGGGVNFTEPPPSARVP